MEKELKKYYKEIRHNLCCSAFEKDLIIDKLDNDIKIYISENSSVTFEDILNIFGEPKKYYKSYVDNMHYKNHYYELKKLSILLLSSIIIISIITLISLLIIYNIDVTRHIY